MKATIGIGRTALTLIAALALTGCTGLIGTHSQDLGIFSQQELNAARRIHHDAPYWAGTTTSEASAPSDQQRD